MYMYVVQSMYITWSNYSVLLIKVSDKTTGNRTLSDIEKKVVVTDLNDSVQYINV